MHHIVSDGWSQGVFNRELGVLYEAYAEGRENPLPPLGVQYADFAMWQREWLEGGELEEGLRYWKEELAGIPEQLELPTDRPRPAVQTYAAEVCQVVLGAEQLAGLKRLCGENQATLYMALMAGFGVLLGRYSGQEDIVVGSAIANRQDAQLEEMIGFFVNTLVMRLRVKGGMSFRGLLGGVRATALGAYRHQDIPFERLVEELNPERSLSRSPVYQVVFDLQNAPRVARRMKGLEIVGMRGDELRVHLDLEVNAVEQSGGIGFSWMYNRDLFERWRMEQMAVQYVRVLEAMIAEPEGTIGRVDVLGAEERRRILEEWNDTRREVAETTAVEMFEAKVERSPEAVAVVFEGQRLSYGELNRRANQLAGYLRQEGVGPEEIVGICLERSLEMVVALLGVLKAGGAYLPLDPEYPEERLKFMVESAGVELLLVQQSVQEQWPSAKRLVALDSEWQRIARGSGNNLESGTQ